MAELLPSQPPGSVSVQDRVLESAEQVKKNLQEISHIENLTWKAGAPQAD